MLRTLIPTLFGLLMVVAAPVTLAQETPAETPIEKAETPVAKAQSADGEAKEKNPNLDDKINKAFKPATDAISKVVFFKVWNSSEKNEKGDPVLSLPFILVWLAGGAMFLTIFFRFINLRSLGLACRTVRGKYSSPNDPGEITHFQALTAALSATVGLGNIAGVAIAISKGGPGAAFWMIVLGFLGMTTKFAECTLGVKYREIDEDGKVRGGPMHYLTKGLKEKGMASFGKALAVIFAILCIGASLGGGNMFQVNQACSQFINVSGGEESILYEARWVFGLVVAVLVAVVIIGGITRIASVTSRLVPLMCITYLVGAVAVLGANLSAIPDAIGVIISSAFKTEAYVGGLIGAMLVGIQRGTFSNEAGIGSAPIAHAAVKTKRPASEGLVALLEPFTDTVIVCSMTALVIVVTGNYGQEFAGHSYGQAIETTSDSFATVIKWFPFVLFVAVLLFAISTLISWSYYGAQAWSYLFGKSKQADLAYKLLFCIVIVVGSALSLGVVTDFSDAMLLAMCFPNLIGVFILLPVVKSELNIFVDHARKVDAGEEEP